MGGELQGHQVDRQGLEQRRVEGQRRKKWGRFKDKQEKNQVDRLFTNQGCFSYFASFQKRLDMLRRNISGARVIAKR